MKKAFACLTLLLTSVSAFAAYPEDVCRSLTFESERIECARYASNNAFAPAAVDLCNSLDFSGNKVSCLKTIANKIYSSFEIQTCASTFSDYNKLSCLGQVGRKDDGGGYNPYPQRPQRPQYPPQYPQNPQYPPQYPQNPPVNNSGAELVVRREIVCESEKGRTNSCHSDLRAMSARLVSQLSKTACVENQNYVIQGDRVQVSAGCRAVFEFTGVTTNPQPNDRIDGELVRQSFTCESKDMRQRQCGVPSVRQVIAITFEQQLSKNPCIAGQSYTIGTNTVTVSNGCRATFSVQGVR